MKPLRPTLVLLGLALASSASADVIEAPRPCAPWQDVEYHHGATLCTPRACHVDAQCSGGHCYNARRVCVISDDATGHGPRDREAGPCASDGRCEVGRCLPLGTCAQ